MLQKEVKEWLAEYKGLAPTEVHTFACTLAVNEDLVIGLYDLFETPPYNVQELDPVCHQLYEFYRSKEKKLVLFALQFVPVLTWLYLRCLSLHDKKNCSGAETFLLGVYNLEIVHADGAQKVESFRIPTVSRSSLYHESRIGGDVLTEQNLRQLNNVHGTWRSGPFQQHVKFNAQNRFSILSHVMLVFNNDIDSVHSLSLEALCRVTTKLCSAGFTQDGESYSSRVALHSSLLIEFLAGIYFAMFNGHSSPALKAVQATHERASYELYSDVLLVTNGLLNSHPPGRFSGDSATGIEQKRKKPNMLKNFITNASFKAKKLPDDIEIVEEEAQSIFGSSRLATVDEEAGISTPVGTDHSLAKGLKARLMTKLGGDRSKYKEVGGGGGSNTTTGKKESTADFSWNNAAGHQHSPRWDGDGSRRDSERSGGVRRDSDSPSMDSVGVAVKTFSLGGQGDRGKVVVDMLEMEPIKGKRSSNEDDDDGADLYDIPNHYTSAPIQASPRQGLWSAPTTPSPTSAPAQSPLAKISSKKMQSSATSAAAASASQGKSQPSPSGSGVDPKVPEAATPNGKATITANNNSGSTIIYSGSKGTSTGYHKTSSSRFSYTATVDGTDGSKTGLGVSQSKTSPSLVTEPELSQSVEQMSSSMSSPPSSTPSYQSPRDAFFGITSSSQSGSTPAPNGSSPTSNGSNPAPKPSSSSSSHSLPGEQAAQSKSASKVNRNSYSTDL